MRNIHVAEFRYVIGGETSTSKLNICWGKILAASLTERLENCQGLLGFFIK
jgi:hypothetical protein